MFSWRLFSSSIIRIARHATIKGSLLPSFSLLALDGIETEFTA
jgi:hypothetical protein